MFWFLELDLSLSLGQTLEGVILLLGVVGAGLLKPGADVLSPSMHEDVKRNVVTG